MLRGAAVGCKGLGAIGRECPGLALQAQHTLPRTQLGVARGDAQIVALTFEHGARLCTFVLGVLVVGLAGAHLDALYPARQLVHVPLQRHPVGAHANGHFVLCHRAVVG